MTRDLAAAIGGDGPLGLFADATAKATVLVLLAWSSAVLLRRRSAALRHRIWALALCGSIAMPVASWLVPGWRFPALPEVARQATEGLPAMPAVPPPSGPAAPSHVGSRQLARLVPSAPPERAVATRSAPASVRAEPVERTPLPSSRPVAPWSIPGIWLMAWGIGGVAVGLPTLLALLGNRRVRMRSRPVVEAEWLGLCDSLRRGFAIRRPVELLRGDASAIPVTWGVVRPVVLLPDDAAGWPDRKRRLVLLHELAHVRRLDAGVQLVGRLAAAIYWFHPLAWYALHRLRVECEYACDDCVVLAGERPTEYAGQLLELARSARLPRPSMNIAMARSNALEDRLRAMFDETRSHRPLDRRSGRRLAAGAVALVLGLAMVHPGPAPARPAGTATPAFEEPPPKWTGRIAGRVVRDGQPAGAAEVILLPPPPNGQEFYYGKLPLRRTTADAGGAFAFDGLAPGRYRVWANLGKLTSRPRHMRGEVVIIPASGAAPGPVELRLIPAIRVSVRVAEKATGRPIPGATIQPGWSDFVDDFTTDRDGRVPAQPFTPERWRLDVWADGFAKQSRWLNLENGSDAEAEFRLEPGGDLEGVVRDPAGRPVPGVGLSVFLEGSNEQFEYVETDGSGRYRLAHLPANVPLRILEIKTGELIHEAISTRVTAARQALDVTLRPRPHGGSIAGIVRDRQGRPISGAELINPGNSSSEARRAKTGPDGRFRLENLYESITGKEVIVQARGFAPVRVKVEPGPPDRPAEIAIAMEPGHRLRGRVTDDGGRPIEGVRVYFGGANHAEHGGGDTRTDAQGRFEFDSLPPGTSFAFSKDGYSGIDDRSLPLDTGEEVTVQMAPAGVILGRVVDSRTGRAIRAFKVQVTFSRRSQPGEPSAGIRSVLIEPGQVYQSDEGRFKLSDLLVGMPLQVMVSADGYERGVAERVVVARPAEARVEEIRLDPLDPASLRTYRGRLRDFEGKPVVAAQVRLIAARDRRPDQRADFPFNWTMIRSGQLGQQPNVVRFLEATTDAKGIFQFAGVPKGIEVELAFWGRGIAPGRADHLEQIAEDKEGWFDIKLPVPARVAGTVDRKEYPTAARLHLDGDSRLLDANDIELKPGQSDFAFEDLPAGQYTVRLMTAFEPEPGRPGGLTNRTLASQAVTVQEGETAQVDFKP